ncbi:MAG: amidohydrolase family protein, partial [Dehalococcoidia bacterium]
MNIDIHTHYFPKAYLEALSKRESSPILERDELGRTIIINNGVRFVTITDAMTDIDLRLQDMDACGMDMAALSLTTPSVDLLDVDEGVALAQLVNDEISGIAKRHPDRLVGLATLPFRDMNSAMDEMDRAIDKLGMKGIIMCSNIAGTPLDAPQFLPFFQRAHERAIPVFIHPTTPAAGDIYRDYRLAPMFGFVFDTTITVTRLILAGVLDKYPNLKLILAHLGGTTPYLVDRMDFCYQAYPECRVNVSKPPSEYLKLVYFDSVCFYKPSMMCALAFA